MVPAEIEEEGEEWDLSDDEPLGSLLPATVRKWKQGRHFQPINYTFEEEKLLLKCDKPKYYFQKYISEDFF